MAIKDKTAVDDLIEWNVDVEVQLFYAMRGHKPVGVNRHFQMACILNKFRHSLRKDIGSQQIWDRLDTMYDMSALHESEIVPFPNDELDFVLPEREFGLLLKKEEQKHIKEQKLKENKEEREKENKEEKEKTKEKTTSSTTSSEKKQKNPAASSHSRSHEPRNSIDSTEEKESGSKTSKHSSSKPTPKDRVRESKEVDSPKRKRVSRGSESKSSSRDTPPNKKRRT